MCFDATELFPPWARFRINMFVRNLLVATECQPANNHQLVRVITTGWQLRMGSTNPADLDGGQSAQAIIMNDLKYNFLLQRSYSHLGHIFEELFPPWALSLIHI